MGCVDVKHTTEHELTLEWESSANTDMIADATMALITSIDKSPASVKRTSILSSSPITDHIHSYHSTAQPRPSPYGTGKGGRLWHKG